VLGEVRVRPALAEVGVVVAPRRREEAPGLTHRSFDSRPFGAAQSTASARASTESQKHSRNT
jgi:hypothetical protein